jgi:predicted Zn-dependent protease
MFSNLPAFLFGLLLLVFSLLPCGWAQAQPLPPEPVSVPLASTASLQASAQAQAGDYFHLQKKIYRWSDKTKFVLVHISTAQYLPDWQPWNVQIIKDAFAEWQHAMDNRLMFVFVNDPSQADVIVQWWNTATPEVEKGACGLNKLQTWGKYIAKNDIYVSLHSAEGEPWPPNLLYATALHEIGHMLGIRVHSDNPGDMMYYATTHQLHLTARDINTIRKVYAAKADYTNPPGYHLSRFEDFQKTQKNKGFWIPIIIPIPL